MTGCEFYAGNPRNGATQCGARAQRGSAYCPQHHALCHRSYTSDAKREAAGKFRERHLRLLAGKELALNA